MYLLKSFVSFKDPKKEKKVMGLMSACDVQAVDMQNVGDTDPSKLIVMTDRIEVLSDHPVLKNSRDKILFLSDSETEAAKTDSNLEFFNHILIVRTEPPQEFPADKVLSIINAVRKGGLTILDHLNPGAVVREFELSISEQRTWFRDELSRYIETFMGALPRPSQVYAQYATEIQDELLMNAIWDASQVRATMSRKELVKLAPDETVKVKWAFDGFRFAVSVRDRHGSFPPELYRKYVTSLFSPDARMGLDMQNNSVGGAGLGLFMILERASELTINVAKGSFTDVVVVLNFSAGPKAMSKGPKTFQFFNLGDR